MHSTPQRGCFTKQNRLPDAASYRRVFNSGRRGVVGRFKWFAQPNEDGLARLGLVVSKKSVAKATQRNRIKRLMRESFRCNQNLLTGFDVIVVANRKVERERDVLQDLSKIWRQVSRFLEKQD